MHESEFAKRLGKFRLERISKAVERLLPSGDSPLSGSGVPSRRESCRGIARIKCTNPQGGSRSEGTARARACAQRGWSRQPNLGRLAAEGRQRDHLPQQVSP